MKHSMSRLQQCVLGDEPLHALSFQKLNGSPVDLAAVLWLSQRSQLLLDVLQPQIYRGGGGGAYFKLVKCA